MTVCSFSSFGTTIFSSLEHEITHHIIRYVKTFPSEGEPAVLYFHQPPAMGNPGVGQWLIIALVAIIVIDTVRGMIDDLRHGQVGVDLLADRKSVV